MIFNCILILVTTLSVINFLFYKNDCLKNYNSLKELKISILETQKNIEQFKCSCKIKKLDDSTILNPIEFPIDEFYVLVFLIILILVTILLFFIFFYLEVQLKKKLMISFILLFDTHNYYIYFLCKLKLEVAQNIANKLNIQLIELERIAQTLEEATKTSVTYNIAWLAASCLLTFGALYFCSDCLSKLFYKIPEIAEVIPNKFLFYSQVKSNSITFFFSDKSRIISQRNNACEAFPIDDQSLGFVTCRGIYNSMNYFHTNWVSIPEYVDLILKGIV